MDSPTPVQLAWLAGLWDGEGSTGASKRGAINVQMVMTDQLTIERAIDIIQRLDVSALGYHYQRKPPWNDAFHIRVNRMGDILKLAEALIPYAVTKKRQWEVVRDYCASRVERRGLDSKGRIRRGGNLNLETGPTKQESDLLAELATLNQRGRPPR